MLMKWAGREGVLTPNMKRKRRHLTAEFKARVALEALKEEKTIQQIAINEDVAPAQVSAWKKGAAGARNG
jgi:transposase-like protein